MDAHEFERKLRERLATRWNCTDPVGVQPDVLEQSLRFVQGSLPDLYLCFLKTCGVYAGTLFFDYHWKVETGEARNREMRLPSEDREISLRPDLYTFLDYIGDYFWCLPLGGNSDPEVLMFDNTELSPTNFQFSDFILKWEQFEAPSNSELRELRRLSGLIEDS
jgi:hypothetical protein